MGRKVASEDNSEEIFDKLRDSTLEIIAELGDTQLSLSDIYHTVSSRLSSWTRVGLTWVRLYSKEMGR